MKLVSPWKKKINSFKCLDKLEQFMEHRQARARVYLGLGHALNPWLRALFLACSALESIFYLLFIIFGQILNFQKLGFASCKRNAGATEGINVLIEKKNLEGKWTYGISCIEYTEFDKFGMTDNSLSSYRYSMSFLIQMQRMMALIGTFWYLPLWVLRQLQQSQCM